MRRSKTTAPAARAGTGWKPLPSHWAVALACTLLWACGGGAGGSAPTVTVAVPSTPAAPLPTVDTASVPPTSTASSLPQGWHTGAIMQIFVRSYQDSDGDGIGDLRGLTSRLDYLQALGVKGLWLMPVHPSQDQDHGYAVTNYRAIDPRYGTLADFDALVQAAHARGIGIVLDYVLNHSAAEHPAFVQARSARDNPFRSWYVWSDTQPTGWSVFGSDPWRRDGTGWYYAPFWDQMPDFNWRLPAVAQWHADHLRFWMNRGVDGFRLDAVGLLVENGPAAWVNQAESRSVVRQVRSVMDAYAHRFLVCEGADDVPGFAQACGNAFAFDLNGVLMRLARSARPGSSPAAQDLQQAARYFETSVPGAAPFLSNHDSFAGDRVWNQLNGDLPAYRLAAASMLLVPGTPFLYYGEEIGLAAADTLSGDPRLRTPMSWTGDVRTAGFTTATPYRSLSANVATQNVQAQRADPQSLWSHYQALLGLRNTRPSLSGGRYHQASVQGSTWSFVRTLGQEHTVVLLNYGAEAQSVSLRDLPTGAVLRPLYASPPSAGGSALSTAPIAASAGTAVVEVPPRSVRVLDLSSPS